MQNSYSHHNNENAFVFEAIQRMTEARYIKQPNGRPFISPQEFEIGMFILMSYMKQMTETMEIRVKNLDELSTLFVEFVYSGNHDENTPKPDKAKMQRALKRLNQLRIIKYRAVRWPTSDNKSVRRVIITVKPKLLEVATQDLIFEKC